MARARKLTDDEIIAALEAEESNAIDSTSGELAIDRARALERYRGLDPEHVPEEGRSGIVSRDVTDTIEAIMPSLVRVFMGGEDIGQFQPRGPEDEEAAKAETEVVNWMINEKSDFFSVLNAALRDALLVKNGYAVAFWKTKTDVLTEIYTGQADEELALLLQDPEVEIVEHTSYPDPLAPPMQPMAPQMPPGMPGMGPQPMQAPPMPAPMLHDVKVARKTADEYVAVESIPPDELRVSRHHRVTSLLEADFVEWVRRVSLGQLRAEGFDVDDEVDGSDELYGSEQIARERYRETDNAVDTETEADPLRRIVVFRDAYIRIDLQGKGEPQLWRLARVAGSRKFALKTEVEIVPFAAFSPIIYPHSHIGTSVFDLIDDVGQIKTQLQRNLLDGQYLALSGQTAVDVDRVTIEDMLVSRPGGIKRVNGNPADAIFPIPFTDSGPSTLSALTYMDSVRIARSGVSGTHDAIEANTLNRTATGVQAQQAANNMRIELIARTLASGFRDLFLIVHALALKHSTKPLQVKLNGKWTPVSPREWRRRDQFILSVGLGTGTPEAQMQKLLAMGPVMQQGQAVGLVGPDEIHRFSCELWKAAGYRVYDRFIKEPQKDPQTGRAVIPPPQPPPQVMVEQMRQQGEAQKLQAVHAHEQQMKGMEQQDAAQRFQADDALKQRELQMSLELQRSNDERQSQLDQQKAALEGAAREREMELERYKIELETQAKREIEQAKIEAQMALKRMEFEFQSGMAAGARDEKDMGPLFAPKTVLRDGKGRVMGVDVGGVVHEVVRDDMGRVAGMRPRGSPPATIQ